MRARPPLIPPVFISLLKWAVALGVAFVLFVYVVISLGGIALTFTPYITKTISVSRPIFVEGTPTKTYLHIIVMSENTTKHFDASERAQYVLAILRPHVKGEPQVKLSLYSYKKNNTTYYHLSYNIDAQLKDLNVSWGELVKTCDELKMSFYFDEKGYEELREKAEEKAKVLLEDDADKKGKASFFLYFGKKLVSEKASCYHDASPRIYASEGFAVSKAQTISENVNPGTEEVRCYVYRNYALFGIGFGPKHDDYQYD